MPDPAAPSERVRLVDENRSELEPRVDRKRGTAAVSELRQPRFRLRPDAIVDESNMPDDHVRELLLN